MCCVTYANHTYMYAILEVNAPRIPKRTSFALATTHVSITVQIESNSVSAHQCYIESEGTSAKCT